MSILRNAWGIRWRPYKILPLTSYGSFRSFWPIILGQVDHSLVVSIKVSTSLLFVVNQSWSFHLKVPDWKKKLRRIRNDVFINVQKNGVRLLWKDLNKIFNCDQMYNWTYLFKTIKFTSSLIRWHHFIECIII